MRVSGRTKQRVRLVPRRRVDHLRRVVRRAARRASSAPRSGRETARSGNPPGRSSARRPAACSAARSRRPAARNTACCSRTSSSDAGTRPRVTRPARCLVSRSGRPYAAIDDGIEEDDRAAVRFGFVLRELEQVQRAFDVDLVRRDRRELGARREQRREMEDQIDLELRHQAFERARDRGSTR